MRFLALLIVVLICATTAFAGSPQNTDSLQKQRLDNLKKAKEYADSLRPKAENGDPKAQLFLGNYYGPQFFSCDQIDKKNSGPLRLDQPYCTGYRDAPRAAFWYRKAAGHGEAEAQLKLGKMYENGAGVNKDYKEAYFWYSLSARHYSQSPWMKDDLKAITQRLTPEQISAIDKRVANWKPTPIRQSKSSLHN